ncbi:MAG: hypothetical protein GVX78_02200 [Bacteroidetes bacterium]|jgi:nicotinamide mononucleotide transporter|nr:hypothetical protein [Bacteroidota bacterium]
MQIFLELFQQLGALQIFAFLFALAYIFFAAQNSILCWIFGICSSGLWAYETWVVYGLFYDSLLNVFYVIMGILGWLNWARRTRDGKPSRPTQLSGKYHVGIFFAGLLLSIIAAFLARQYTEASLPFIDAPTTIFSIIATFLLIKKDMINWIYWIFVDAVYVGIYLQKGAFLFSFLFLVYTLMAMAGWFKWRKLYRQDSHY